MSSRQPPYRGSDRQARGELLLALTSGPVHRDGYRADIVGSLLDDGLVIERFGELTLP